MDQATTWSILQRRSQTELETSVFIIPGVGVKYGDDRLVVLNRVATSVVEARRAFIRSMCSPMVAIASHG